MSEMKVEKRLNKLELKLRTAFSELLEEKMADVELRLESLEAEKLALSARVSDLAKGHEEIIQTQKSQNVPVATALPSQVADRPSKNVKSAWVETSEAEGTEQRHSVLPVVGLGAAAARTRQSARASMKKMMSLYDGAFETDDIEYEPVPFLESMWNLILVSGNIGCPWTDIFIAWFLFALNVFMQVMFTLIVMHKDFLGSHMESRYLDAVKWRNVVAHDETYMSSSRASLVSRVCKGDASLVLSTEQKGLVADINSYFGLANGSYDETPDWIQLSDGSGTLLCLMCIMLWLLYMVYELRRIALSLWAVLRIPRGKATKLEDDRMLAISPLRLGAHIFTILARLALAAALLWGGILWITRTSSKQDLILNAIALGAILEIDSMMFAAVMPLRVQFKIQDLEAVKVKYTKTRSQIETGVMFLVFLSVLALAAYFPLNHNIDFMMKTRDALCGGLQDFVMVETDDQQMIYRARSIPFNGTETLVWDRTNSRWSSASVLELAVYDAWNRTVTEHHVEDASNLSSLWPSVGTLYLQKNKGALYLASQLTKAEHCTDFRPGQVADPDPATFRRVHFNLAIERLNLSRQDVTSCADMKGMCSFKDADLLRYVCPVTCGCDNPYGDLLYRTKSKGCMVGCETLKSSKAPPRACVNIDTDTNPDLWQRVAENVADTFYETGDNETQRSIVKETIKRNGCDAFLGDSANNIGGIGTLCRGEHENLGSISFICPEHCGCEGKATNYCPKTCTACADNEIGENTLRNYITTENRKRLDDRDLGLDERASIRLSPCEGLFLLGKCEEDADVRDNCQASCKTCSAPCVDAEPASLIKRLNVSNCQEIFEGGRCETRDAGKLCKQTCGYCSCMDVHSDCGSGCEVSPELVVRRRLLCARTCNGVCTGVAKDGIVTGPTISLTDFPLKKSENEQGGNEQGGWGGK